MTKHQSLVPSTCSRSLHN